MVMNKKVIACLFFLVSHTLFSLSPQDADAIAVRIWNNECAGTIQGLTCWNKGENFASLGIGHFIWFPEGSKEPFQQTFPDLIKYIQSQSSSVPQWIIDAKGCPWKTRDEFYADIDSPRMQELRKFLLDTKPEQANFIAMRLETALPQMVQSLPKESKEKVSLHFAKLSETPQGLYALIDYANFKGLGTLKTESYNGQGWGLLQVLLNMPETSSDVVKEFKDSAKAILTQRVENSPKERRENRFLNGWINRINTY